MNVKKRKKKKKNCEYKKEIHFNQIGNITSIIREPLERGIDHSIKTTRRRPQNDPRTLRYTSHDSHVAFHKSLGVLATVRQISKFPDFHPSRCDDRLSSYNTLLGEGLTEEWRIDGSDIRSVRKRDRSNVPIVELKISRPS